MMKEPLAPATFFYTGIIGAQDFMDGKADEVAGFKAVDDYTVEITLDAPDSSFLWAMTMPFTSVMPEEWAAEVGKDIKRKPLGTGPFTIESWTPGRRSSPSATRTTGTRASPTSTRSTSTSRPTRAPRCCSCRTARSTSSATASRRPTTSASPPTRTGAQYTYDAPEIAWYYVFMNVLEKPFDNLKLVRQAVNHADRHGQDPEDHGRPGASPRTRSIPKGMPGQPGQQGLLRATTRSRRSRCSPRPASPTASRPPSTATTSTRSRSSPRRSRPTSRRSASTSRSS